MKPTGESSLLMPLKRLPPYALVAISSWGSRIVIGVIQLFLIRILIGNVGTDGYAVIALMTGLTSWFLLADGGLGSSLQNHISEHRAQGRSYRRYLISAAVISAGLLIVAVLLLYLLSPWLSRVIFRNITFLTPYQKGRIFFTCGILLAGFAIGGVAYRIWYGEQKGYWDNIVNTFAAVVSLGAIWSTSRLPADERIFWSAIAYLGPNALFAIGSFLWKATRVDGTEPESPKPVYREMLGRSFRFWLLSLSAATILNMDTIMISQFLPPGEIVIYNITVKIFEPIYFVYNAVLLALWPVFAESFGSNSYATILPKARKTILIGATFIGAAVLLLAQWMPYISGILSPKEVIAIPTRLIFLYGAYQVIRVWTDMFGMILLSRNDLLPFWIVTPVQAIINFLMQYFLTPRYGAFGVVAGLIGSYLLTVSWLFPLRILRYNLSNTNK